MSFTPFQPFRGFGAGSVGSAFDSDASAVIAAMTTAPDSTRQTLINDTIMALKSVGLWVKVDDFIFLAAHDQQASLLKWKSRSSCSLISTPAFMVDQGWVGGAGMAIDTGINGTTTANYSQNSACFGVYSRTDFDSNSLEMGARLSATSKQTFIRCRNITFLARVNEPSLSISGATSNALGLHMANRSGANDEQLYKNGELVAATSANPSDGAYNGNFYILTYNNGGLLGPPSPRQIAFGIVGASLDAQEHAALYSIVQSYMTGVVANV